MDNRMTHNLLDLLMPPGGDQRKKIYGVVVGIVTNNQDPDKLGRVKVRFPWLSDTGESWWARIAAPMAGKERGFYFLPEVEDEVLIAFEHGDVRFPYVLGALWNGEDKPPETNSDGKNNMRVIKSRSGHIIRLNDEDGKEKLEIIDKSAKNSIVLDTAENTITITTDKDLKLSAVQGTITLEAKNIDIIASAAGKFEANQGIEVKAGAAMTIKGSTVDIN
jgi:uncharacterized protein involved in type VI secretion and phage assembly